MGSSPNISVYCMSFGRSSLSQGMGSNAEAYDKGDLEKTAIPGVLEGRVENVESAGQTLKR